jgi:polyisoprenoid-binding protein YceI
MWAQSISKVNVGKSTVKWEGKKVTGAHNGAVSIQSGKITHKNGVITSGDFVIDMNSITCADIENPDYNKKLVGHLKNEDFFDVAKYPTATLVITKVAKAKNQNLATHVFTVNLTIKGITKSMKIPAKVTYTNGKISATSSFIVDRSLYDIKYGSETFFGSLGDKAIKNEMYFDVSFITE